MSKPLLTANIFTYNHKDTIARCIESHLHQKTAFDMLKRKKKMLLLNKRRHELLSGAKEDK